MLGESAVGEFYFGGGVVADYFHEAVDVFLGEQGDFGVEQLWGEGREGDLR